MEGVRRRSSLAAALLLLLFLTLAAVLAAASASVVGDDDDAAAAERRRYYYMLVGMQTGGGDKNRLVVKVQVLAGERYYMSIAGFAQGFSSRPRWFFGQAGKLIPLPSLLGLGNDGEGSHGSGGGSSHDAEVVASNLLAALMNNMNGSSGSCSG